MICYSSETLEALNCFVPIHADRYSGPAIVDGSAFDECHLSWKVSEQRAAHVTGELRGEPKLSVFMTGFRRWEGTAFLQGGKLPKIGHEPSTMILGDGRSAQFHIRHWSRNTDGGIELTISGYGEPFTPTAD